jgi:thioesterase domain-containing protein
VSTVVLVPGACHGGWWYQPLAARIEQSDHAARALTLAGLEDEPQLNKLITLRTHIDQVADEIPAGGDVVLVGHSYAGSVITGVADRLPTRIAALVYLDAFLPEDGDSCWSMTTAETRDWYVNGSAATGYGVDPLPFFDARARPHPVATFLQALPLTGAWRDVPVKHYAAATWPGESPMALSISRAEADPGFAVHYWNTRHNILAEGPDLVLGLLRTIPCYRRSPRTGPGRARECRLSGRPPVAGLLSGRKGLPGR